MAAKQRLEWIRYRAAAPGLDWAEAALVDLHFSPHRHDTYAVGVTTHGVQAFTYRGVARASCPGDVFVLHPDELHDGRPGGLGGFGYRIVYVAPELIGEALGGAALPFVVDPLARDRALRAVVPALFPHPADPRETLAENDRVALLAGALARASGAPLQSAARHPRMARVKEHLAATCAEGISLAVLEREHGLDRFTLARQFRKAYGVSPSRFVTLRRLDLAKRAIAEGRSLAAAAATAGFADQAHMTRQFRAAVGTTPGKWRTLLHAA